MHSGLAVCYLYSPAIAWQSFLTVALWLVCAGREMQRGSLAAGGQSVPARSASQPEPLISRACRKEPLFGVQSIPMYLLRFQEVFASFKQQGKKASLYVPNQCHYKSCSSVRAKHHPELSFFQWFSPIMAFNVVCPEFPVHLTTMSCDAGRSPVFLLWMGCARSSSSLPAWSPGWHSWSLPGSPRCPCSAPEDGRE